MAHGVVVVVVVVVQSKHGVHSVFTFDLQTVSIEFASNSSIILIPQLVVSSVLCRHYHASSRLPVHILDVQVESTRSTDNEVVLLRSSGSSI